jgi:polyhydroxybutyrate depolymerase
MTISAVRAGSSILLSALFSITLLAGCSSSDGGSDPVGGNPTDPTDPNTPDPIGDVEPGTPTTKTVMVGDDERSFVIYAPSSSSNKSTKIAGLPAVIIFHGTTQNSDTPFSDSGGANLEWLEIAEEEGVVLVAPNGSNLLTGSPEGDLQTWNNCGSTPISGQSDDMAFVDVLLDVLVEAGIDENRIYATGGSNGGKFSYRVAIELSDRIAGIAAFSATLEVGAECGMPTAPVPTMIVNGTMDPILIASGVAGVLTAQTSTEDTVAYWRTANATSETPVEAGDLPDSNPDDGSTITRMRYEGGAPVLFYQVNGGGHYIPSQDHDFATASLFIPAFGRQNRDVEGAREAWAFFSEQ